MTQREKILFLARSLVGLPYVWGGNNLRAGGLDCSGGVQFVLAHAGVEPWALRYAGTCDAVVRPAERIDLPAQGLFGALELVPAGARIEPGDLEFYGRDAGHVTHVMFVVAVGADGAVGWLAGQRNGTSKCVDVPSALAAKAHWDSARGGYRRDVVGHRRPRARLPG